MRRHAIAFAAVALCGAAIDQLTKHLVFRSLEEGDRVVVIDGFFEIGCTLNHGIAFGMFPGFPSLFLWVALLAAPVIAIIFARTRPPRWTFTASLGLILAGTLGNLTDRLFVGAVRDFILFHLPRGWPPRMAPWHLFNIADACISVAVVLLLVEVMFFDRKRKPVEAPAPAPQPPPAT